MGRELNIKISKAIVHILNTDIEMAQLSNGELELNSSTVDYINNHLTKIVDSNKIKMSKSIQTGGIHDVLEEFKNDKVDFTAMTRQLAMLLFGIMIKHVDIPPADVLFTIYDLDGIRYLGILKMNYKVTRVHATTEQGTNLIMRKNYVLPNDNQKLDEAVFINLETMDIGFIEKKYEINGEREFYLSNTFLNCQVKQSNKESFDNLSNVLRLMNNKYFDGDFQPIIDAKKCIKESIDETGTINIKKLSQEVFHDNYDLKYEFIESLKKRGIDEFMPAHEEILKRVSHQLLRLDNGIEINLPIDAYDNFAVDINSDGTLTVKFGGLGRISSKF